MIKSFQTFFKKLLHKETLENSLDEDTFRADIYTQDFRSRGLIEHIDLEQFKSQVNHGVIDLFYEDDEGYAILSNAAGFGRTDILQYLVEEKNLDPSAANSVGFTPSHAAALYGHLETLRYLLDEQHADITKTIFGDNLLHFAAQSANLDLAKYLVQEKHLEINHQNHDGDSSLHSATKSADSRMMKYLVDQGAHNMMENNEHENALDLIQRESGLFALLSLERDSAHKTEFLSKSGISPSVEEGINHINKDDSNQDSLTKSAESSSFSNSSDPFASNLSFLPYNSDDLTQAIEVLGLLDQ